MLGEERSHAARALPVAGAPTATAETQDRLVRSLAPRLEVSDGEWVPVDGLVNGGRGGLERSGGKGPVPSARPGSCGRGRTLPGVRRGGVERRRRDRLPPTTQGHDDP